MGRTYTASEVVEKFAISRQTLTNKLQSGQIIASKNSESGVWEISEKALISAGIPYRSGAEKTIREKESIQVLTDTKFTEVFTRLEELANQFKQQGNLVKSFTDTIQNNQKIIYAQLAEKIDNLNLKKLIPAEGKRYSEEEVQQLTQKITTPKDHKIAELENTLTRLQKIIKQTRDQLKESGQTWDSPENHYFLNLSKAVKQLQDEKTTATEKLTTQQEQLNTLKQEKNQLTNNLTKEKNSQKQTQQNYHYLLVSGILSIILTVLVIAIIVWDVSHPLSGKIDSGKFVSIVVLKMTYRQEIGLLGIFGILESFLWTGIYYGIKHNKGIKNFFRELTHKSDQT